MKRLPLLGLNNIYFSWMSALIGDISTDLRRLVSQLSNCDTAHISSRNSWPFLWASIANEVNQLNVIKEKRPALSTGCWYLWWQWETDKRHGLVPNLHFFITNFIRVTQCESYVPFSGTQCIYSIHNLFSWNCIWTESLHRDIFKELFTQMLLLLKFNKEVYTVLSHLLCLILEHETT